jgi:hypothetical protein
MNKTKIFFAFMSVLLLMAGCDDTRVIDLTSPGGTRGTLSGDVTIIGDGNAFTGTELVARYDGLEPVTVDYQWYRDGVLIPDAIGDTYIPNEPGVYTVRVSATGYDSKTSDPVTVTHRDLEGDVAILGEANVFVGTELTAEYSGSEAVTYQWYKDGDPIDGAAEPVYTPGEPGQYTVIVSLRGYNEKTSDPVTVTYRDLEGDVAILGETTVLVGMELAASYSGEEPVNFQWYRDGDPIDGATGDTYIPNERGQYTVAVSLHGYNDKTSEAVTVSHLSLEGDVTILGYADVFVGTDLTAEYSGSEIVTYQWHRDGAPIPGAIEPTYTANDPGEYYVIVSAANYESKSSGVVTVTLRSLEGGVSIRFPGAEATIGTELAAEYTGSEAVAYQWNRNGTPVPGETGVTYTPAEPGNYTVTVSLAGYTSQTSSPVTVAEITGPYHWYISRGGPEGDNYEISNEVELRELAKIVNDAARLEGGPAQFDFNGKTVILAANVFLNGEWTPIGTVSSHFAGTFEGNGNEIYVLTITGSTTNRGLFHTLANTGRIRNLGVIGNVIGGNFVGGIAARNNGLIESCYFNGMVRGITSVGGITGKNAGEVRNCFFIGRVYGSGDVGGIAGTNDGEVENCYNIGNVTSTSYAGGIAGYGEYGSILRNNVSLGLLVTGTDNHFGRVAGKGGYDNLYGNKARADMKIGENEWEEIVTDGAADNEDGADVAVDGTVALSDVFAGWDTNIWNISGNLTLGGELPTLKSIPQAPVPVLPVAAE